MPIIYSVYKETEDDWCRSFTLSDFNRTLVKISYMKILPGEKGEWYRILISGTDDFMMNFDTRSEEQALTLFNHLCVMKTVNIDDAQKLGMQQF